MISSLPTDITAIERKQEIERKKARLEELRLQRMQRSNSQQTIVKSPSVETLNFEEINELVDSLIGPKVSVKVEEPSTIKSVEKPRSRQFEVQTVEVTEIIPETIFSYSKEIQTDFIADITDQQPAQAVSDPVTDSPLTIEEPAVELIEPNNAIIEDPIASLDLDKIVHSESFMAFFGQSTKIMERALNSKDSYDIFKDYKVLENSIGEEEQAVNLKCAFNHERWTKNRAVTSIDWSAHFPELILASFGKNTGNVNESDGLVLVWNVHMPQSPEFVLFSQSDVTVASFSPFHPSLIVGGTYSGQIIIWDTRIKNTPVLATSLALPGHSHPVYSLKIVGTRTAHNLITASTDGVVCSWQMDILANPQEKTELAAQLENGRMDEVAVTCLTFQSSENSSFLVGTEESSIYQVNRFDRAESKAGIEQGIVYKGHSGAVTGIEFHPSSTVSELKSLFLSSSLDCTIKLWKVQACKHSEHVIVKPLKTFEESQDYICDIAWSPTHPAVFASVDGLGNMALYNLNVSEDTMVHQCQAPNARGLNKVSFDKSGNLVAVASLDGSVFVWDVSQLVVTAQDDATRFARLIRKQ